MGSYIISDLKTFCPTTIDDWRNWLQEHHLTEASIWLLCYKQKSEKPSISWSDAVDQALCFGWIDSTRKSVDHESFIQFFTKRKPKSIWSKINKEKVTQLIEQGLMTEAGLKTIEIAKQNGSWNSLDEVEALVIPEELKTAFEKFPQSEDFYLNLSKSVKKMILHWIVMAKRPETRQKRIAEFIDDAEQGLKPKQFR